MDDCTKQKLKKNSEVLKCHYCDIIINDNDSYLMIKKKKICLECLISNNKYKEKLKIEYFELEDLNKSNLNKNSETNNSKLKNSRNYGIDLLRIFAMTNVVILHVMNFGKILYANQFTKKYYYVWLLETFSYSAVNTFGMISGYVMINTKFNGFKIIPLWLNVFFYDLIKVLNAYFFSPTKYTNSNKKKLLFRLFFPVLKGGDWYFTSYFCMYFFTFYINKLMLSLNKKESKKLISTIIIIFVFYLLLL